MFILYHRAKGVSFFSKRVTIKIIQHKTGDKRDEMQQMLCCSFIWFYNIIVSALAPA